MDIFEEQIKKASEIIYEALKANNGNYYNGVSFDDEKNILIDLNIFFLETDLDVYQLFAFDIRFKLTTICSLAQITKHFPNMDSNHNYITISKMGFFGDKINELKNATQ